MLTYRVSFVVLFVCLTLTSVLVSPITYADGVIVNGTKDRKY